MLLDRGQKVKRNGSTLNRSPPPFGQTEFENSSALRKVLGNTSWLVVERIVNMTVRFFVGVWVIRYLGPAEYGVYSYAVSFVGLFAAFATLGLDNIVIRNLVRSDTKDEELLATALVLRLSSGIATIIIVVAAAFLAVDQQQLQAVVLIVAGQLIFSSADVFDLWFQAQIKSKYPVWVRSVVAFVIAGSQIAFILYELPVAAFAALVSIQALLHLVGTYGAFRIVAPVCQLNWRFSSKIAKEMMADAWPLILAGLSVSIYMKIDQVMLGELVGQTAVGIYATAVKVSELWYFLPLVIAGSVFPKIVSSRERSTADVYCARMQLLYDAFALISYVIIAPLLLSAGPLVSVLFGEEYAASASVLQVHIWAFLFVALGVARSKWLIAENMTRFAMLSTAGGAVVNLALNVVLIPQFGVLGAAWATLASYGLSVYGSLLFVRRLRPVLLQISWALVAPFRIHRIVRRLRWIAS